MVSPGWEGSRPGLSLVLLLNSAKGPVSRILSCAVIPLGAALPRTLISDLPGGFGDCIGRPDRASLATRSSLTAPGRHRARVLLRTRASLPIWSCSVWGLPCLRRYRRSGALLPHHFTLTPAGLAVQANLKGPSGSPPGSEDAKGVAEAVSFLWHWPSMGFEAHVPDVIRHTALRSSDFPPPANLACAMPPAATARSSCQGLVYRESEVCSSSSTFAICCRSSVIFTTATVHTSSRLMKK